MPFFIFSPFMKKHYNHNQLQFINSQGKESIKSF
jgi:hypothetical protein